MINMTVIGGLATLSGPFIGAIIVYGIQEGLRNYGSLATLISGILLVAIISLAPGGIARAIRGQGLRRWR
jgi:branched-chain amino acid transport system permease protein